MSFLRGGIRTRIIPHTSTFTDTNSFHPSTFERNQRLTSRDESAVRWETRVHPIDESTSKGERVGDEEEVVNVPEKSLCKLSSATNLLNGTRD